jgi:hypothetical protein
METILNKTLAVYFSLFCSLISTVLFGWTLYFGWMLGLVLTHSHVPSFRLLMVNKGFFTFWLWDAVWLANSFVMFASEVYILLVVLYVHYFQRLLCTALLPSLYSTSVPCECRLDRQQWLSDKVGISTSCWGYDTCKQWFIWDTISSIVSFSTKKTFEKHHQTTN